MGEREKEREERRRTGVKVVNLFVFASAFLRRGSLAFRGKQKSDALKTVAPIAPVGQRR